jgi:hypothetical protein
VWVEFVDVWRETGGKIRLRWMLSNSFSSASDHAAPPASSCLGQESFGVLLTNRKGSPLTIPGSQAGSGFASSSDNPQS